MNLGNLEWQDGQSNPSGIGTTVYYIPKTQIKSYPKLVDPPSTPTDAVSLDGDFVLHDGAKFNRLYSTQGKGSINFEGIGEKDCKMYNAKGTFKFPDLSDEAKAFAMRAINSNVVFIVVLPTDTKPKFVVLGDYYWDCEININGASGDAPGTEKGLTIEVTQPTSVPFPNYTGEIKTDEGALDCATGAFTPKTSEQ